MYPRWSFAGLPSLRRVNIILKTSGHSKSQLNLPALKWIRNLVTWLQTLSEACGSEFASVYGRIEAQERVVQEMSACIQNADAPMSDDALDQRLTALEDGVDVELSGFSSRLNASEDSVLQLNAKVDISLAKTDNLQQQISALGNRLTSLESAFSSFSSEVNQRISQLFARFDVVPSNCSACSALQGNLETFRSTLSQVDEAVHRHSAILEQTDIVKAHGHLAAEVIDQRRTVSALQSAVQSLAASATRPFVPSTTTTTRMAQSSVPQSSALPPTRALPSLPCQSSSSALTPVHPLQSASPQFSTPAASLPVHVAPYSHVPGPFSPICSSILSFCIYSLMCYGFIGSARFFWSTIISRNY